MTGFDTEFIELFRDETARRLDDMDNLLLEIESGDADADAVNSLFRHAHTIKGAAGMLGFDDVRALAHGAEDVLARVRDADRFSPEIATPLLHATAAMRVSIAGSGEPIDDVLADLAGSQGTLPDGTDSSAGGARPAEGGARGASAEASAEAGTANGTADGDSSGAGGPGGGASPAAAVPQQAGAQSARQAPGMQSNTLRVPADKIDHLLDVAGEIMQYRTRLAHSLGGQAGQAQDVAEAFGAGERMLDDLKDTAVGMRTLPLAVIAGPLPRMVRDVAQAAGKEVEFVVTGADTELDRVILESLSEPLGHLLRNAVIHGVESPAERERAGKPARGRVELRATPRGSLVEIVVTDDGRGASSEVIGEARREGSLADVLASPGYSTAEKVTDLAGRGVGLDAVRTYVHSVGGSLDVRSEPGQGMEVIQLLPVALALMEVLLFERGAAVYGVPLAVVEKVVMVTQTLTLEGRSALEVGGRSVPVADFADLIGAVAPPLGERPPALVISLGGRRAVVTCDALLGEEEVVVKPLGPLLASLEGYLGASILGDGRIALLVEPAILTRRSHAVPALTGPSAADGRAAAGRAEAPKVLVVEDSFTVRELQRSILEAAGYSVVTARDGRDALAVLDRDAGVSLVITDLEMPGLDGIGLTRAIRAGPARSSLPVIIVTSRAAEEDRLSGIEAGADAYMAKRSFDQQALLATVERLVGR
jgi:two-component system, chemotaxis family, sensor kinase CheA